MSTRNSSLRRASHRAPSLSRHCSVVHPIASPVIIFARQGSVRGGVGQTASRRSANSRVCFVLAPPSSLDIRTLSVLLALRDNLGEPGDGNRRRFESAI